MRARTAALLAGFTLLTTACMDGVAELAPVDSTALVGADETRGTLPASFLDGLPSGTVLRTTAPLNLRNEPSLSSPLRLVIPAGALVMVLDDAPPTARFFHVDYQRVEGWASGVYLDVVSLASTPDAPNTSDPLPVDPGTGGGTGSGGGAGTGGGAAMGGGTGSGGGVATGGGTGSGGGTGTGGTTATGGGTGTGGGTTTGSARDLAIARAQSGVGFSYWWGHGRWLPGGLTSSTAGTCTGSCPSCTHTGGYGADCSGYVGKIWQVGTNNSDPTVDKHPYSTLDFIGTNSQWSTVSRGAVRPADALVYNTNGSGHIFLYESGDGWGSMWAYEAKGCATGIVHNLRTASSSYKAIQRTGY